MNTIEKLQALRTSLVFQFPERQNVIDGCLASVLASEHVLLLGPPGTAKSALARSIAQAFDAEYFERLLTKFSTPDEVFGPVSLRALEQDRFERVTHKKLPEAEIAFIDEVYKANSAILNSLLAIMNERVFHNAEKVMTCPLISLIGASNELPEGKDLEALSDRFLVRFEVRYVTQIASLRDILKNPDFPPLQGLKLAELRDAQEQASQVKISETTIDGLIAIREACQSEGIIASDRRWKKSLKLVQSMAYLAGEDTTTPEDLSILVDVLWREPNERGKISRIVSERSDPTYGQVMDILDAAREVASKLMSLKTSKKSEYIGHAADSIDTYQAQIKELQGLAATASKRGKTAINDSVIEIRGYSAEARRIAASSLGVTDQLLGRV